MKIRYPFSNEAETLTRLALNSKSFWGYDSAFINACKAELEISSLKLQSSKYVIKVGVINSVIVGFYCLERLNPQEWEIEALFVSPEYIGKGLGTQLWAQLVADAEVQGITKLVIASDPYAEPFYLKMGANRVGKMASGSIPGRVLPLMEYRITAE